MNSFEIIKEKISQINCIVYKDDDEQVNTDSELQDLVLNLDDISTKLKEGGKEKLPDYVEVINRLTSINPNYLQNYINSINIATKIIYEILINTEIEDLLSERNENAFEINEIESDISIPNCYYIDTQFENSMLYCSLEGLEEYYEFINNIEVDTYNLLISFLEKLQLDKQYNKVLFCKNETDINNLSSKIDFLKITQVSQGKVVHIPDTYSSSLNSNDLVHYDNNVKYNQFDEIIEILNEYNIHTFILDKYLRLYHILENFMYKNQICKLSKDVNYRMFTIRDFKSLNENMCKKEMETLCEFIKETGELEFNSIKFKNHLFSNWCNTNIVNDATVSNKIENSFRLLGIRKKDGNPYSLSSMNEDTLIKIFPKMIYRIRNSIVHNKVNELHLSYSNLDENIKFLMENIIMNSLEYLIYNLLLNKNDLVWYRHSEIKLYED
ncbi:hypothetical protein FDG50_03280 [Clostridium botulinum]|uniref:hypothetical protein n=1 Tax=Clostridium botulinum TaxID=1491 RepID=UPI00140000DB|nr:hypothetical protein [Clostridium botulinum]MBY6836552.1 hypothetical protein [Clostridium botulinum]NFG64174.1 hypothetical protein [Clostridium botulinum]NFQ23167.1 hypothetical protein [Clostridium botulinum]